MVLLFGGQCEALARCQEGKNVVNPIETLNLPFLVPIAFMLLLFPCHPKAFIRLETQLRLQPQTEASAEVYRMYL